MRADVELDAKGERMRSGFSAIVELSLIWIWLMAHFSTRMGAPPILEGNYSCKGIFIINTSGAPLPEQ